MKVSGTDAKDIAIYFLEECVERYTPQMVGKSIIQAKSLLKSGYSVTEVKEVIDYINTHTDVKMYSLGYVSSAINDVINNVQKEKNRVAVLELKQTIREQSSTVEGEVEVDIESAKRNKRKTDKFGHQSKFGEEFDSDLFK